MPAGTALACSSYNAYCIQDTGKRCSMPKASPQQHMAYYLYFGGGSNLTLPSCKAARSSLLNPLHMCTRTHTRAHTRAHTHTHTHVECSS
mmetsp:Transcript_18075/g.38888  ORF Transcript_18075/g.38888 Transcript_18075/m.38888 type:complete len:90 (+) Transcript_18075:819-1088(+)